MFAVDVREGASYYLDPPVRLVAPIVRVATPHLAGESVSVCESVGVSEDVTPCCAYARVAMRKCMCANKCMHVCVHVCARSHVRFEQLRAAVVV